MSMHMEQYRNNSISRESIMWNWLPRDLNNSHMDFQSAASEHICKLQNGKFGPITGNEGPKGEQRYNSTLSLTSSLDVGGWLTPRPGRFTPGMTRYPLYRRLGGRQCRSGRVRKISPSSGFNPRTVQPAACR